MADRQEQTILVVDDNDDVRRLLKKVLEASGYGVEEAANGEEALAFTQKAVPDLVLMDMHLPGICDGLETTRRLKTDPRLSGVPVVALTANVLEKDRKLAMAAGCSGFIGKPVDITSLSSLIEKHMVIGS